MKRRGQAKQNAREESNAQCKQQYDAIQVRLLWRPFRNVCGQNLDAPVREQKTASCADGREKNAFGEELADQAAASAPRASRKEISGRRATARASRRLPTFATAINNTIPTTTSSTCRGCEY